MAHILVRVSSEISAILGTVILGQLPWRDLEAGQGGLGQTNLIRTVRASGEPRRDQEAKLRSVRVLLREAI